MFVSVLCGIGKRSTLLLKFIGLAVWQNDKRINERTKMFYIKVGQPLWPANSVR